MVEKHSKRENKKTEKKKIKRNKEDGRRTRCSKTRQDSMITFLSANLVRRYSVQSFGSTTSIIFNSNAFPLYNKEK